MRLAEPIGGDEYVADGFGGGGDVGGQPVRSVIEGVHRDCPSVHPHVQIVAGGELARGERGFGLGPQGGDAVPGRVMVPGQFLGERGDRARFKVAVEVAQRR